MGELRYKPYGETRHIWGVMCTDRRYTGQREEVELGLYDYGARFYDPLLARFISADTIVPQAGNPQALNRYSYVENRPLVAVDLNGHFLNFVVGAAIGAVVGGAFTGAIYYATTDNFDKGEFWTAVGVGAAGGALIGTGIGAVQGTAILAGGVAAAGATGLTVSASTATAATIAVGMGTGTLASANGYMLTGAITRQDFDKTDFLITSGVGTIEGAVSAVPGMPGIGRVLTSGAAGACNSALSDHFHGRDLDWNKASLSGVTGLASGALGEVPGAVAGIRSASPGLDLGPPVPQVNTTLWAARNLSSNQSLQRTATSIARYQMARSAIRTTIRDTGYEIISGITEDELEP